MNKLNHTLVNTLPTCLAYMLSMSRWQFSQLCFNDKFSQYLSDFTLGAMPVELPG